MALGTNVVGHIENYCVDGGEDWDAYVERLEQYFVANGITEEERKRAIFLTVIGSKAYSLLRDLVAPEKPAVKSYIELVEAMKKYLDPKPIVIAERFRFHRRNQEEGETVAQYVAALRRLAEHCKFRDYLDEALRDRLVCGLRNEHIQRRLLAEEDLTLQKAFQTAQGMEAAQRQADELQSVNRPEEVNAVSSSVPPVTSTSDKSQLQVCFRCGRSGHLPDKCFFRNQLCHACKKRGHIARTCRQKPLQKSQGVKTTRGGDHQRANVVSGEDLPVEEEDDLFTIKAVNSWKDQAIIVSPEVNGKIVNMELDTGASVSIMPESTWRKELNSITLQPSKTVLRTYTGEPLEVMGQTQVLVKHSGQEAQLPLIIVKGRGPSLFGRNWLGKIKLEWGEIKRVADDLNTLLKKYENLFEEGLGTVKDVEVKLAVQPGATPKFCKARPVPYALKEAIENDLERLEGLGVIEPVQSSDWATPIVAVPKADGSVRLCGDFKVTLNPALIVDQYPLPKPEDLFATLNGGKKFSKIDLSHAYQQLRLEEGSRKFVTVNTHRGLYRYNRLPFGVASAPAIFQKFIDQVMRGVPRCICYMDDVLVTGTDDEDHLKNLKSVFERCDQRGLRLKKSKCFFMRASVEYLGYQINAEGLQTTQEKVEAITKAPRPENVKQLRSFMGLVNYYGKFVPDLATVAHPLHNLLRKDVAWKWDRCCEDAFKTLKERLASSSVLVHYDVNLPLKLDADASYYGIGAVISHVFPDGSERPVAYASRTLSQSERNYCQLEKEALSLIFGVKRFHQFLYGRHFTLVTDHKPLTAILGPKTNVPPLAAARMQRWALLLSSYQYDVEFRPTAQHANADGLSRLPLPTVEGGDDVEGSRISYMQVTTLPVKVEQLKRATAVDPILSKVLQYTLYGWPKQVDAELIPYHRRQAELSVEAGCLLWGLRVVVPAKLRKLVLEELHVNHPGIVRMKSLARLHVWWPNIDKQVEEVVHRCPMCQSMRNKPVSVLLHPWNWPTRPWHRVSVDFAGPFQGAMFLVVVDCHSKWLEVIPMSTTSAKKTIEELRKLFAQFGLPQQLVTDNGPQFTAMEFESFLKLNGVKHLFSPPYHPATNGQAERFVQTFKRALRCTKDEQGNVQERLSRFLLSYRSTPNVTTGVTPAELFLGRRVYTRLDLLKPSVADHVSRQQEAQKRHHDVHSKARDFAVGQTVLVENVRGGPKWFTGIVLEKEGPLVYKVLVEDKVWRRHADQLLSTGVEWSRQEFSIPTAEVVSVPVQESASSYKDLPLQESREETPVARSADNDGVVVTGSEKSHPEAPTVVTPSIPVSPRYPRREHRPPDRLSHKF